MVYVYGQITLINKQELYKNESSLTDGNIENKQDVEQWLSDTGYIYYKAIVIKHT